MTKLGLGILLLAIGCMATAANTSSFESTLAQGTQLLEEEEYADAAEVLDEAIDSLRAEQGGDTLDTVRLLLPAAIAYAGMGKDKRGYAYFETAFELLEQSSSEDKADLIVQAFTARWSADFSWGYRKKMSKQLAAIYDAATKILGYEDLRTANMATKLGTIVWQYGRRKEAVTYLDQAYTILTNASFVDPDPIGSELLSLGAAYARFDRMETADKLLKIAMAIGASTDGPEPIRRVAPIYPTKCLNAEMQGEVSLVLGVDNKGRVHDVHVTDIKTWHGRDKRDAYYESCRKGFEKAAVRAAAEFRYIPRLENGLPVVSEGIWTTMTLELE